MEKDVQVLYEEEKIQKRIVEMAREIDEDYKGKTIVVISILKGAVFFTVDLVKNMKTPIELEVMQVSSYQGMNSTGKINIKKDLDYSIEGKDVLIIEDTIDTGITLKALKEYLLTKNPSSLKIATLTDKKERRIADIDIDYIGFEIPNKFIVGYGLDYNEIYRNLPYIGYIEE